VSLAIALSSGASGQRFSAAALTRSSGFSGVDGAFRLQPEGTTERALAILEVQKFGAGILEQSAPLRSLSSPTSSGGSTSGLRNLFNFN
jgi:hypothetical protein